MLTAPARVAVVTFLVLSMVLTACGTPKMLIKRATIACKEADSIERLYRVAIGAVPEIGVEFFEQTFVDVGACYRVGQGEVVQPKETVGNARKVVIPGRDGEAWVLAEYVIP